MSEPQRASRRRLLGLLAAGATAIMGRGTVAAGGRSGLSGGFGVETAQSDDKTHSPPIKVDLNLALDLDASGSVNQRRFELQRRGYVEAFGDPRVLAAIRSGPRAAIGVSMYQWTGPRLQASVVGWTHIHDETSIRGLAEKVAWGERYLFGGGTSISGAIDYGVQALAAAPFDAARQVIDISGDGANNRGRAVNAARNDAVGAGININGLPILELEPDLDEHYSSNVIGGPGAFIVAADTFEAFSDAIRLKLIREIASFDKFKV